MTASTPEQAAFRAWMSSKPENSTIFSKEDRISGWTLEADFPSPRTWWPRVVKLVTSFWPMFPVTPATRTSMFTGLGLWVGNGSRVLGEEEEGMNCGVRIAGES